MFKNKEIESSLSKEEKETQINRNLIFSDKFTRAVQSLDESKACIRTIIEIARKMLEHHNGDKYEDLYFIDAISNSYKYQDNYYAEIQKVEPTKEMLKMLVDNPNIIGIHNHPNSTLPSLDDFHVCEERNYRYGLVFCHNGSIYKYKVTDTLKNLKKICCMQALNFRRY
ncbi:MAG: hypothetical protein ACI4EK_02985 [Wujia sp.]